MISFLDKLRGAYVQLPPPVRGILAPLLSAVPVSLRYGGAYRETRRMIERSRHDAGFVETCVRDGLRDVMKRAAAGSRHFAPLLRAVYGASFDPEAFAPETLEELPVLTKAEIAARPEAFLVAPEGACDVRNTSGSSGRPPAKIFLERGRSVREMAFVHHIWSQIGYRLGDGRAVLRDHAGNLDRGPARWRYDPALRELWLSPFHLSESVMDEHLDLLRRFETRFLYGVPSAISILAGHALRRRWRSPKSLRAVLTASETLFPEQRSVIAKAFGAVPVLAFYGMTERVGIAGELMDEPDVYEFEPLYGVAELVDDDGRRVIEAGRRGRIICTGLFSRVMSLIRYDVGDRATLVRPAGADNCYRLRVSGIRSRWSQEFLVGRDGELISPVMIDQANYYGVFCEHQYYQETPGKAVLQAVLCEGVAPGDIARVMAPIHHRVGDVLDIRVEPVEALPVGRTGKRRMIDQRIPGVIEMSEEMGEAASRPCSGFTES